MNGAWHSEEASAFYQTLDENRFERNMFMGLNIAASDPSVLEGRFSNLRTSGANRQINRQPLIKLLKLSFYRYFPLTVTASSVIYTSDISGIFTTPDALGGEWDFVARMSEDAIREGDFRNAFIFYHLTGTHRPFRMDERGRLIHSEEEPGFMTNYSEKEDQLCGFFYLISDYIRQLKEKGAYENSGIIILADHGSNTDAAADHQPIYFIKMPGEQHDTIVTDPAPITIQDVFLPDVLTLAGGDGSALGTVSASVPDEERERWTRAYGYDVRVPPLEGATYNVLNEYRYSGSGSVLTEKWLNDDFTPVPMIDSIY